MKSLRRKWLSDVLCFIILSGPMWFFLIAALASFDSFWLLPFGLCALVGIPTTILGYRSYQEYEKLKHILLSESRSVNSRESMNGPCA